MNIIFSKLWLRVREFVIDAFPFVILGVLVVNMLQYFRIFEAASSVFAPVTRTILGLPGEAAFPLLIGFLRKDIAAGLLLPLQLGFKETVIACVVLSCRFPLIATFLFSSKNWAGSICWHHGIMVRRPWRPGAPQSDTMKIKAMRLFPEGSTHPATKVGWIKGGRDARHFVSPFFVATRKGRYARPRGGSDHEANSFQNNWVSFKIVNVTKDFLEVLKSPQARLRLDINPSPSIAGF
jgi:hypothetical protein